MCMYLLLEAALLYLACLYAFWDQSYVLQRGGRGKLKDSLFGPWECSVWFLGSLDHISGLVGARGHPAPLLGVLPDPSHEPHAFWQDSVGWLQRGCVCVKVTVIKTLYFHIKNLCMYVCMYVCMCINLSIHISMYVCKYVCMYVCMYECMHI